MCAQQICGAPVKFVRADAGGAPFAKFPNGLALTGDLSIARYIARAHDKTGLYGAGDPLVASQVHSSRA